MSSITTNNTRTICRQPKRLELRDLVLEIGLDKNPTVSYLFVRCLFYYLQTSRNHHRLIGTIFQAFSTQIRRHPPLLSCARVRRPTPSVLVEINSAKPLSTGRTWRRTTPILDPGSMCSSTLWVKMLLLLSWSLSLISTTLPSRLLRKIYQLRELIMMSFSWTLRVDTLRPSIITQNPPDGARTQSWDRYHRHTTRTRDLELTTTLVILGRQCSSTASTPRWRPGFLAKRSRGLSGPQGSIRQGLELMFHLATLGM